MLCLGGVINASFDLVDLSMVCGLISVGKIEFT